MFNEQENTNNLIESVKEVLPQTKTLEISRFRLIFVDKNGLTLLSVRQDHLTHDGAGMLARALLGQKLIVCTGRSPGKILSGEIVKVRIDRETTMNQSTDIFAMDAYPMDEHILSIRYRISIITVKSLYGEDENGPVFQEKILYVTSE